MKKALIMLAVTVLGTAAYGEPATGVLAEIPGAGQSAVASPPSPPAPARKIQLFPTQADLYRWYQDGRMGPTLESVRPAGPRTSAKTGPLRAYRITVASSGGMASVEIARSTAAPGETPLVALTGGRSGEIFSGTVLLGDSVQMAGSVDIRSGIKISHHLHFTVVRIPFSTGAKFMVIAGNGLAFANSESGLALDNTAEAGFRVDVPIGRNTTLLRVNLTGGPGVTYRASSSEGSQSTSLSGTVMGNVSILNW